MTRDIRETQLERRGWYVSADDQGHYRLWQRGTGRPCQPPDFGPCWFLSEQEAYDWADTQATLVPMTRRPR